MPLFPIGSLSPSLPLAQPEASAATRLGSIPNIPDGLPGIGGIGQVELPGLGVLPGPAGIQSPGSLALPGVVTAPSVAPSVSPAPQVTGVPSIFPTPEVTPFPVGTSVPGGTAVPGPVPLPAPTPVTAWNPAPQTAPFTIPLQRPAQGSPYSTQPITTNRIPNPVSTPITAHSGASASSPATLSAADTFGKYLQDAVSNYNSVQNQADNMVQRLATGGKVDIHDVSLAVQKAAITNQLAIQVRNRLVSAYQEVMRMQM
ncbi:MAG: flagellar hook-basal body complex protein FliE [Chloroflexota bacterium]